MSSVQRIELVVDVFDAVEQRALPLKSLTVQQMIDSILHEFAEIDYLGREADAYRLQRVDNGAHLDNDAPLQGQVSGGDHLRLIERPLPTPPGTWRPTHHLYLRDRDERGGVYRIGWLPAFVGRPLLEESDELLAVNLQGAPTGMRVSRRHLRLSEEDGRYFVEALSDNPATVQRAGEAPHVVRPGEQTEIRAGDTVLLDRSNIHLRFIVRERGESVT